MTVARRPSSARPGGIPRLALCLVLSLCYCLVLGAGGVFNTGGTYEDLIVWMAGWVIYWLVFAPLQVRWWARGYEKFWRPVYAWSLLGSIVLSLVSLPLLLWPRFRRWLFRVIKPVDPPS